MRVLLPSCSLRNPNDVYSSLTKIFKDLLCFPWPVWLSWRSSQKVTGSIPGQGTGLGCRFGPGWGACKRQPLMFTLPPSPPRSLNPSACPLVRIKKKDSALRSWDSLLLSLWRALCASLSARLYIFCSSGTDVFLYFLPITPLLLGMAVYLGTGVIVIFAVMNCNLPVKFLTSLAASLLEARPIIHYNSSCQKDLERFAFEGIRFVYYFCHVH